MRPLALNRPAFQVNNDYITGWRGWIRQAIGINQNHPRFETVDKNEPACWFTDEMVDYEFQSSPTKAQERPKQEELQWAWCPLPFEDRK